MTTQVVKTQQELETALADEAVEIIHIDSPKGVWLTLNASGSATVEASGSATVEASGSATVEASGSATVRAYGSATVRASGSATVRAYDSATVRAYDSATVRAYGSATVRAYGSATVRAYDSATVTATPHVAVHLHAARATVTGGVIIDIASLDLSDPRIWAEHHGVELTGDGDEPTALLYKAVSADLAAGQDYRLTRYPLGERVVATDWRDDNDCGFGLHISPRPWQAKKYRPSHETDTRFLRVAVPLADLRPISADKAKARVVRVLGEVDIDARDLTPATA